MWDLGQIIQQNNQAAVDYMMRGQKADQLDSSLPVAWTLEMVAARLRIGPPSLSALMDCCMEYKVIQKFLFLIRDYLPEHEEEILKLTRDQRLHRFSYLFSQRYFPLPAYAVEKDLSTFVAYLPVLLAGMSHDSYHELNLHPAYVLLLSLVVYPYAGSEAEEQRMEELEYEATHEVVPSPNGFGQVVHVRAKKKDLKARREMFEASRGPRVPLIDKVRQLVGKELAYSIPTDGWDPEWLHLVTDGTKYAGLGEFADWACSQTGCTVLDCSYADCSYIEGAGEPLFQWTRRNVEILTEEWPRLKKTREAIDRIVAWMEQDQDRNFGELLHFLLSQKQPKKSSRHPYGESDHWCPLEQVSEDDNDDEDNEAQREAESVLVGGA